MNRPAVIVAALFTVCGVGLALRLPGLNVRPMHVDEAVHACKFDTLWTSGKYAYDPAEYHGPTLYYFTWPAVWLSGAVDFVDTDARTFRLVPVVFGAGVFSSMPALLNRFRFTHVPKPWLSSITP